MKSHLRRTLVIAPLLAAALLVCVSGSAWAANVVGVEIYSPTESSPIKWVRPGSSITVMTRVTVDGNGLVRVSACVGSSGQYVQHYMTEPSKVFSISVEVPKGTAEDGNSVSVIVQMLPDGNTQIASEPNAVYVDVTAPVVTLGALPTTPTTNPRPTWAWSGSDNLSGVSHYIVTLDSELPIQIEYQSGFTSFTPSSNLADGAHVLKVKAVDKAGNVAEKSFAAVTVDTTLPAAPAIEPIARGYNTSPLTLKWNKVPDSKDVISYLLQWAKDAGFSGFHEVEIGPLGENEVPEYEFDFTEQDKGEDEYWFRVKTVSTVNGATDPKQTKKSEWSAIVSTIYDVTGPAAPVLTLETPSPTNQSPQTWSWSAPAGATGYSVSVDGGSTWINVFDTHTCQTTFSTTGTHTFKVKAYDWLGNENLANVATGTVDVDVTPPGKPSLATASPRVKAPQATWTWGEVAGAASYDVELDGSAPVNVGNVLTYTAVNLGEGIHSLRVRALDDLGNASGWAGPIHVEVDWTAPGPPPAPETTSPTASSSQTWVWDALSDKDSFTYEVRVNSGPIVSTGTNTTYPTALGDGEHYLQVRTKDDLGNVSAWSEKGRVIVDTIAPDAPVITLVTPSPTNEPLQKWSWTRTAVDIVRFQFGRSADGALKPTSYLLEGDVDNAVTNFTTDGAHYVMVRAIDAAGNVGDWSAAASVVVDLTPPGKPSLATASPRVKAPQATWTWGEVAGAASYDVELDGSAPVNVGNVLTYTAVNLGEGIHSLRVRALDDLGNASGWAGPIHVEVDWTAPGPPPAPETTSPTASSSQTWVWDALSDKDSFTYEVRVNSGPIVSTGTNTTYPTALGDGEHYLQVRTKDDLGNVSAWSEKGRVIVDTIAPDAPVITLVTPSPTNEPLQKWSWTRTAVDIVRFQFGRSADGALKPTSYLLEGDVDNAVTNFTTDGAHYVMVRAIDAAGNVGDWSAAASVVVDLTPPGKPSLATASPRVKAPQATWTWGEVAGAASCDVELDGSAPVNVGNVLTYTAVNLGEGIHSLRVRALDDLGNASGWAGPIHVEVDWTAPGPPPAPETTSPTASSSQTWVWDALSDKDSFTYEVRVNSGPIVSTGTNTTYPTALGDGEHYLQVRTKDDLGNVSAWSEKGRVIVDTIAPDAPVITLVTPSPTNEPLQKWSWTRTAVDIVRFQFGRSADGALKPTSYLLEGDVDNAVTNFTTDGAHYVMVRAIDAAGNVGDWSAAASVVVDLTPPGVPSNLRVQSPTKDNTPEWMWDAADNPDGDLAGYELLLDGAVVIDVGNVLIYTHSEMLSDGVHTMRARSYDSLGNPSAWTDPATSVLVDATPPEVPGMPRTESPTANRRPTWTWNATSGTVAYRVFLDGVAQQPVDTEPNPNGIPQSGTTFTPAADLADGWHDLQVTAIDALGNESAKSAAGSVLVDGTPPAAPDMAHLPELTKATQVVFRWSSMGDVAGYNFSYIVGDGEEWTTARGITTQSKAVKGPNDKDLDDRVTVKGMVQAYDSLGNTSEWSEIASTTIDLAGPEVAITAPAGAKNTNLSTFTWTWTGDDGECGSGVRGYWVRLNDEAWFWTTEPVFTSWRLQRGENVLYVKGVDNLGNEGAAREAPAVRLVDAAIFDVMPAPGEHPINEASTIVFSVAGLYDKVEVLLSNKPIEDAWRLVTIVNTPGLAKFYVLLDDAVIQPGPLTVTIKIGDVVRYCDYEVLDERSGFGFGRLRPW